METFSPEELKKYDGSRGISYIAYRGKVYDVTGSYHWKEGVHQVSHPAGCDLTETMKDAPHLPNLLFKFPVVGQLDEEK